jgi:hypothetical protein
MTCHLSSVQDQIRENGSVEIIVADICRFSLVGDRTSVRFAGSFRAGLPNRTEPNRTEPNRTEPSRPDFPPDRTCSEIFEPLKTLIISLGLF